jgi:antitoxin component of RelBE/YafQ-DinJ toxin-antitoxin module
MIDIFTKQAEVVKEETGNVTLRVPLSLRNDFASLCEKHGMSTSEAIRKFMVQAVEEAKSKDQPTS